MVCGNARIKASESWTTASGFDSQPCHYVNLHLWTYNHILLWKYVPRVGYTIVWSAIHECNECIPLQTMVERSISWPSCQGQHGPTNSAITWSRFSGVGYGTLFHSRHCGRVPLSKPAANRWPVPNGTHLGDQPVTDRRPESARPPDAGASTDF